MSRLILALACLLALVFDSRLIAAEPRRPNIVFVLADDKG